ncbi:MAG: dTDP-4-dehydrorhamnose 3,5-epimerase [Gammaproteobacteria bacterium]
MRAADFVASKKSSDRGFCGLEQATITFRSPLYSNIMNIDSSNLLTDTLAGAERDAQTVRTDSTPMTGLPHGAKSRDTILHADDRGSLFEIFDTAWDFDDDPFPRVYASTMRPGVVKGWALHKEHGDRYFIVTGDIQVVMYDVRPDSPTCGQVFVKTLSDKNRTLMTIPPFVWHADHNVGDVEAMLLNMPTRGYQYEKPDKYRLPIDTPLIPYNFGNVRGW